MATETRITSEQAKEAIYKAYSLSSTAITFDDLTEEQKDSLKGEKGDKLLFSDLTQSEKDSLKGQDGNDANIDLSLLATKEELNNLVLDSGNLSQEQITLINSISNIPENLDNIVTYEQGKNLFNINDSENKLLNIIKYNDGLISASSTYNATHFIKVLPNKNYTLSQKHQIAFYDKNKNFIIGSNSTDTNKTILTPDNCYFIRCTVSVSVWLFFQVELGLVSSHFVPYVEKYLKLTDKILPLDTVMFEKSKNLYTGFNDIDNYWVNYSTGILGTSSLKFASYFIEIEANETYFLSGNDSEKTSAWYDSNYNYIVSTDGNLVYPKIAPSNAKYIRFTGLIANKNKIQLEKSIIASSYSPPFRLKSSYYSSLPLTQWYLKKYGSFGDSITAQNKWQPTVINNHNLSFLNYGVGGAKISGSAVDSFCEGSRISAMDTSLDIISIMGGTNDWSQSVPLGLINDTSSATFYGALNILVDLLLTKYPDKRIFFISPPYGEHISWESRGFINAYTNSQNLTVSDYAIAVKNICNKYNLPFCDLISQCGWNNKNIRSYITDDGGLLHPNTLGGLIIGRLVSDFVNRL